MVLSEYKDVINTIHLNSENCLILHPHNPFSYFKNNIMEEIEIGIKYGVKRYVLHMNKWKFNVKNRQEKYINMIIVNLKELSIELEKYDVDIFIENLYEPLPFYEELFEEVCKNNLNRIHHTFDFGHAKVWGEYNIENYFRYLKKLKYEYQRKFHFHVHTNNGLFDEHKSFLEGVDTLKLPTVIELWDFFNSTGLICQEPKNLYI
jgi:endonuclease IV